MPREPRSARSDRLRGSGVAGVVGAFVCGAGWGVVLGLGPGFARRELGGVCGAGAARVRSARARLVRLLSQAAPCGMPNAAPAPACVRRLCGLVLVVVGIVADGLPRLPEIGRASCR